MEQPSIQAAIQRAPEISEPLINENIARKTLFSFM